MTVLVIVVGLTDEMQELGFRLVSKSGGRSICATKSSRVAPSLLRIEPLASLAMEDSEGEVGDELAIASRNRRRCLVTSKAPITAALEGLVLRVVFLVGERVAYCSGDTGDNVDGDCAVVGFKARRPGIEFPGPVEVDTVILVVLVVAVVVTGVAADLCLSCSYCCGFCSCCGPLVVASASPSYDNENVFHSSSIIVLNSIN
jgi:hypothetical protein